MKFVKKKAKALDALEHYNSTGREVLHKFIEALDKIDFNVKGAEESTKQGSTLTTLTIGQ